MADVPGFTGTLLPVFFVEDMDASVAFYRDLCGFRVVSHHDEASGKELPGEAWNGAAPWWVRMAAGAQEFALHLNGGTFSSVGGTKHYFEVESVDDQHQRVCTLGADPGPVQDFPWMRLFGLSDPDGHMIYFQTPNTDWRSG